MALSNKERYERMASGFLAGLRDGSCPILADRENVKASLVGAFNPMTRTRYRGVNALSLGTASEVLETGDPRFLTRTQIEKEGLGLRAEEGEAPAPHRVYFVKACYIDDEPEGGKFIDPGQTARKTAAAERAERREAGEDMPDIEFQRRISEVEREVAEQCRAAGLRQVFMLSEYAVYHASHIEGISPYAAPEAPPAVHVMEAIMRGGISRFRTNDALTADTGGHVLEDGTIELPPEKAYGAVAGAYYGEVARLLCERGVAGHGATVVRGSEGQAALSAALAHFIVSDQLGLAYRGSHLAGGEVPEAWASMIEGNPKTFMHAARNADNLAEEILSFAPDVTLAAREELAVRPADLDASSIDAGFMLVDDGPARAVEIDMADVNEDASETASAPEVTNFSAIAAGR